MYRASLLVVGTEIAEGIIQDSHTQYLASVLRRLGFRLVASTTTPDEPEIMSEYLRFAVARSELVLVTGGLGPTSDDRSREVVADVAGRSLSYHEEVWERLRVRWRRWHGGDVEPAQSNRRQAYIPEGFEILANDVGSAPGFIGSVGAARIAALPGPPTELRHVVERALIPILERDFDRQEEEELRGTAFLIGESTLEDALQAAAGDVDVRWGTRAEPYRIDFYLRGGTASAREHVMERLRQAIGSFRIRRGKVDPAAALLAALTEGSLTVCTAESCTGGLISTLITEVPGSSAALWGGIVSYANEAKQSLLGVTESTLMRHGAVSEETVTAMLGGTHQASGADLAIAVSGVAGPNGGTREKPVGTVWIGVALQGQQPQVRRFQFVGSRERVRRKSAIVALLMAADLVTDESERIDDDLDNYQIR